MKRKRRGNRHKERKLRSSHAKRNGLREAIQKARGGKKTLIFGGRTAVKKESNSQLISEPQSREGMIR